MVVVVVVVVVSNRIRTQGRKLYTEFCLDTTRLGYSGWKQEFINRDALQKEHVDNETCRLCLRNEDV